MLNGHRVLVAALAASGGLMSAGCSPSRLVGQAAPDFTLTSLDGKAVTLSQFKGRPVLLSFWGAT